MKIGLFFEVQRDLIVFFELQIDDFLSVLGKIGIVVGGLCRHFFDFYVGHIEMHGFIGKSIVFVSVVDDLIEVHIHKCLGFGVVGISSAFFVF